MLKNRKEPTAARKEPMTKVMEMTLLILIPISRAVSKSREAARMAMPMRVFLISVTSARISTMVRMGVMTVTRFVSAPKTEMLSETQGMTGYCWGCPPVIYHMRFCSR